MTSKSKRNISKMQYSLIYTLISKIVNLFYFSTKLVTQKLTVPHLNVWPMQITSQVDFRKYSSKSENAVNFSSISVIFLDFWLRSNTLYQRRRPAGRFVGRKHFALQDPVVGKFYPSSHLLRSTDS